MQINNNKNNNTIFDQRGQTLFSIFPIVGCPLEISVPCPFVNKLKKR